jgi:hypothetical protein
MFTLSFQCNSREQSIEHQYEHEVIHLIPEGINWITRTHLLFEVCLHIVIGKVNLMNHSIPNQVTGEL